MAKLKDLASFLRKKAKEAIPFTPEYRQKATTELARLQQARQNLGAWRQVATTPQLRQEYVSDVVKPKVKVVAKRWEEQRPKSFGEAFGTVAREGFFGPLPQAAYHITQKFPQTTLPISHFMAGLAGPIPAEKIALGQRLPEREKYAPYRAAGGATSALITGGPKTALSAGLMGGGLGALSTAAVNIAQKKPITKELGRGIKTGALYGLETAPTYVLTGNLVEAMAKTVPLFRPLTEKGIAKTLPQGTQTIGTWLNNLGKTGLKRIVKATLIETPIEGMTYGIKDQKEKQKLVDSIAEQTAENFIYNVGFAGVNTLWDARTITPIVKKSIDDAIQGYRALPREVREGGYIKIGKEPEGKIKVKGVPKELEPLAEEARKYGSAEEFRNALFPSGGAMDISNRGAQRFGRLISSSIPGEELPTARQFAKDLDFEWKDLFRQYGESPPDLTKGKITIWRAAPEGTKIEAGDWVALTKRYAEGHLGQFGRNKLYKMEVSPDDIVNAGTDASEWFYAPKELRKELGKLFGQSQLADFYNQAIKQAPQTIKVAPEVKAEAPQPVRVSPEAPKVKIEDILEKPNLSAEPKKLDEILASSGYLPEQIASISTKEKQRIINQNIPPFSHKSFEQVFGQAGEPKIPTPETLTPEKVNERVAWSEFTESEGPKGIKRLFNRLFNPLNNAPEEVKQTANDWRREVLVARADANAIAERFANIPDEDGWKMVRYIQNPTKETAQRLNFDPAPYQKEIKELRQVYDQVRKEGLKKGLDIGYLENYLNQVWQEPWGEIATKVRGAGARPYFTKERVIPSYEEGISLGLTPRFTHPAQLAAHYKEALSKAVANKKLVDGLIKSGYLVPAGDAPLDWQPITAPLFPKVTKTIGEGQTVVSDYKAPPSVAEAINSIFEYGSGQHSGLEEIAELGAKVSRAMQEVTLSGGFGPANAFTYGQMIKEVTSGRVKSPVTSFLRAFSDKSTKEFFQDNQPYQRMMAEEGIPLYTSDDYTKAFKNLAENKTLKQKLGDAWDKVFNEATFKRFMPMLETNFFKDTYEQAIKSGLNPQEAQRLAGEATKHFYGIADAFSRSKFVEDATTAGLFAPKFRESMVNFWINNAKALLPKNIKNPSYNTNRKFLAGTVITYLLYTATNKALTGHWMHENKGGKELSVEIPVGNDRSLFIPMLPSVGTIPRRAVEMTGALLEGDVATATQKAGSFLSQPISLGSQLLSNRTFYGAPIYQQEDTALQKFGKLGGYALEEASHPLIGEPIAVAQGRKTPFEAGLGLMEVPAYPSASTPEKPLPLARVSDTQTLAAGQSGVLARTAAEEEEPSFLESIFSLRKKKEEPLRELPAKTEELAIVYGDARKALSNYDERRTRIEYGQYTSENKRRQALTELEEERAYAQAVVERIEAEKPEQVFEIGLQTYASGEGMSVEERAEWAAGELNSSADKAEFSKKLEAMLEAGVITKDVATALREEYGLPVYKYKSGGKIVSAGGTGKKIKITAPKFKAPTVKAARETVKIRLPEPYKIKAVAAKPPQVKRLTVAPDYSKMIKIPTRPTKQIGFEPIKVSFNR